MRLAALVVIALAVAPAVAQARPGLDRSFGRGGAVMLGDGANYGEAQDVAALSRGGALAGHGGALWLVDARGRTTELDGLQAPVGRSGGRVAATTIDGEHLQILDEDARPAGPVAAIPTEGLYVLAVHARPAGGWLVHAARYGLTVRDRLIALRADGSRDMGFGNDAVVDLPARRMHEVAVDRRGRVILAHETCRRGRADAVVRRLRRDGVRDRRWRTTTVPTGPGCSASLGLGVDSRHRPLLAVAHDRQRLLRLRATGRIDRRFGRRGAVRLPGIAGTSFNTPITDPVVTRQGPAVALMVRGPAAAVVQVSHRGRVRWTRRTRLTSTYPATSPAKLAADTRGRLLLAGARWSDDSAFFSREDYGTPFPAVWRFRTR